MNNSTCFLTTIVEKIKPIKVCENFKLDKLQIKIDQKDKIGVYCLINLINGNFYIGSSVNIAMRMNNYSNNSYLNNRKNKLIMQNRMYSSTSLKYGVNNLNSYWINGFCDGESSFVISVVKTPRQNWQVQAIFIIGLHLKDLDLLQQIQSFFGGVGKIRISTERNTATYSVSKLNDIVNIILPHFNQYFLITNKHIDFEIWKYCVLLMDKKEHLNNFGLENILSAKSALNWGLNDNLKLNFPNLKPYKRPEFIAKNVTINPEGITGFSDGEASFYVIFNPK